MYDIVLFNNVVKRIIKYSNDNTEDSRNKILEETRNLSELIHEQIENHIFRSDCFLDERVYLGGQPYDIKLMNYCILYDEEYETEFSYQHMSVLEITSPSPNSETEIIYTTPEIVLTRDSDDLLEYFSELPRRYKFFNFDIMGEVAEKLLIRLVRALQAFIGCKRYSNASSKLIIRENLRRYYNLRCVSGSFFSITVLPSPKFMYLKDTKHIHFSPRDNKDGNNTLTCYVYENGKLPVISEPIVLNLVCDRENSSNCVYNNKIKSEVVSPTNLSKFALSVQMSFMSSYIMSTAYNIAFTNVGKLTNFSEYQDYFSK